MLHLSTKSNKFCCQNFISWTIVNWKFFFLIWISLYSTFTTHIGHNYSTFVAHLQNSKSQILNPKVVPYVHLFFVFDLVYIAFYCIDYSTILSVYQLYTLGCPKTNFFYQIGPLFLYGMCIGHTRSHAKFQTSGLNDLAWPPLFVNGSWPSRKSFKMTWKSYFWPCHLEGHQKCSPKWYNTWGFRL